MSDTCSGDELRNAAGVLEAMAIGGVEVASKKIADSPFETDDPVEAQKRMQVWQERKSFVYDAGQAIQTAEVFHRLADQADTRDFTTPTVDRGQLGATSDWQLRCARIIDYANTFRTNDSIRHEDAAAHLIALAVGDA